MTDRDKTKEQLIQEVEVLHRRIAELQNLYERERQLIVYEIHDGFVQDVNGALLHFQSFQELYKESPQKAWETFDRAFRSLRRGVGEARRVLNGLRPPVLDESGILAAIACLLSEFRNSQGPEIKFHCDVQFDRLPAPIESALFRIIQGSLTNARQHSKSSKVEVKLVQQGNRLRVTVEDWGIGFDPETVAIGRLGLHGVQARAELIGGRALIHSVPGEGTRIEVEVPLDQAASQNADNSNSN